MDSEGYAGTAPNCLLIKGALDSDIATIDLYSIEHQRLGLDYQKYCLTP